MQQTKRIEKVWVVTWPKNTTLEHKHGKTGPKDFQSIEVETVPEFTFALYESNKWREVIGGAKAIFSTKREALAWMAASRNNDCFILRRAYLSIF